LGDATDELLLKYSSRIQTNEESTNPTVVRRKLNRENLREVLTPITIGLLGLIWLLRSGLYYLYGQDSASLIRPFNFNHSAVIPYSYLYSRTFPVPDYAPYFFLDSFETGLTWLIATPAIDEIVVIVAWAVAASVGAWLLFQALAKAWFGNRSAQFLPRIVATSLYLVNPFSISVIWWHIEGWTPFYAFLPFLLWFLITTYFDRRINLTRYAFVVLVALCLAPGVTGSFAVPVTGCVLAFLLAIVVKAFSTHTLKSLKPITLLALILLPLFLFGWDFVPYLLLPNPALTSTGYVTPTNEIAAFYNASTFTTPWNSLRLVGFSWLYVPSDAYGWGSGIVSIEVAGTLLVLLFTLGALWIRRRQGLWVFYILGLVALFATFGSNGIPGVINHAALTLGGPFLVLVNSYYIVGEVYVVAICVGCFAVLSDMTAALDSLRRIWMVGARIATALAWSKTRRHTLITNSKTRPSTIHLSRNHAPWKLTFIAALLLLTVTWYPVISSGIYQASGQNIDEFQLPASFSDLSDFFLRNSTGPMYNVLVLPMSSTAAMPLNIGGQFFLDSSSLISNFVPYPILSTNTGQLPVTLMNWFAQPEQSQLLTVLQVAHVKYVLIDPFANLSSTLVEVSPSGASVDWTIVETALNQSLGLPREVGSFELYTVPGTVPLLWAENAIPVVETNDFRDYVHFAAAVSSKSLLGDWLRHSVWSSSNVSGGSELFPYPIGQPRESWNLPANSSALAILANGSVVDVTPSVAPQYSLNFTEGGASRVLMSSLHSLEQLSDFTNLTTDMSLANGSYVNPSGNSTQLSFLNSYSGPLILQANFTMKPIPGQNWVTFYVSGGDLDLRVQLYEGYGGSTLTLGLAAYDNGTPYAWSNQALPARPDVSTFSLVLWLNATVLHAELSGTQPSIDSGSDLYYSGLANISLNEGHNLTVANHGLRIPRSVNMTMITTYPELRLTDLNIFRQSDVVWVASVQPNLTNETILSSVQTQAGGDWTIHLTIPVGSNETFVVLALPYFPTWSGTSQQGTVTRVPCCAEYNVFLATPAGNGNESLDLTLSFGTYIGLGMLIAIAEFVAFAALILILACIRRYRPSFSLMTRIFAYRVGRQRSSRQESEEGRF